MYETKRDSVKEQSGHLESGLSKLLEAAHTVDELSRNAAQQERELDVKQRQVHFLLYLRSRFTQTTRCCVMSVYSYNLWGNYNPVVTIVALN